MKRFTIALLMMFTIITYSQKKKNGTVYIDHPAIDVVEAFEKALIKEALADSGGIIKDTMSLLGLPRKTLYDKMQKYGLDKKLYR